MFVLLRQQAKSSVKVTYLLDTYEADCLLPANSYISQRQTFGVANQGFSSRHAPSALVCSFRLLELTGEDPLRNLFQVDIVQRIHVGLWLMELAEIFFACGYIIVKKNAKKQTTIHNAQSGAALGSIPRYVISARLSGSFEQRCLGSGSVAVVANK